MERCPLKTLLSYQGRNNCFTQCGNLAHSAECTASHCLGRAQLQLPLLFTTAPDSNLVSI